MNPVNIVRLFSKNLFYFILEIIFLPFFFLKRRTLPTKVNKILISNSGHLGDLVILLSVISHLKKKDNKLIIDLVTGSWNREFLKFSSDINNQYFIDLPGVNRSNNSFFTKIKIFFKQALTSLPKLHTNRYDCIFLTRSYRPSYIPILFFLQRPLISFSSIGFNYLLTKSYQSLDISKNEYFNNLQLFHHFFDFNNSITFPNYKMFPKKKFLCHKSYVIIHIVPGRMDKELDLVYWKKIINYLNLKSYTVLVVGNGSRDKQISNYLLSEGINFLDYVNKLDLIKLFNLIYYSEFFISVDSFIGHLCSSLKKKGIIIYANNHENIKWYPLYNKIIKLDINYDTPNIVIKKIDKMIKECN